MRNLFKFLEGERFKFEGVIQKSGIKNSIYGEIYDTYMIKNIRLAGKKTVICDHVWIGDNKLLKGIKVGHIIQFKASVIKYVKGYKGEKMGNYNPLKEDYNLYKFSDFKIVGQTFADNLKSENTTFKVSLNLPKNNKPPKDDWSNFFLEEISLDKKIKPHDLNSPIKSIILNNLYKDRSLSFIQKRVLDFKRWVKNYNVGILNR